MDIRPIHNELDYKAALEAVSILVDADPKPSTADGDRLEILATLVERYESEHFPLDLPDPAVSTVKCNTHIDIGCWDEEKLQPSECGGTRSGHDRKRQGRKHAVDCKTART